MESREEFLNVISLHLNNPEDQTLKAKVEEWRQLSPANEVYFSELHRIWLLSENAKFLSKIDVTASGRVFFEKISGDTKVQSYTKKPLWFLMAASVTLLLGLGCYFYLSNNLIYNTKTTQNQIDSVLLSDGSKVFLNQNTSVSYPEKFKGAKREITLLRGEAFFKVTRDTLKPFSVTAGNSKVTVLGTSFSVAKTISHIKLSVQSGKVSFKASNQSDVLLVKKGYGINYNLKDLSVEAYSNINENDEVWLNNELNFIDASLEEVVGNLKSHFKVEIVLNGDIRKLGKFNAHFKNPSLTEVLEVIQQTYPVSFTKKENSYSLQIIKTNK